MPTDSLARPVKGNRFDPLAGFALACSALLFYVVVVHLRFIVLPALFLSLGFISYAWKGRKALRLFLLLLPLVSATPDFFFNGYPFNYMAIPLFYLAGILCASLLKREKQTPAFPGRWAYLLFLALLGLSALFVFLRWSNLGFSPLAFLRDTPVAPSLERLSFACVFPAVTLALFSLTPFLAVLLRHWQLSEDEVFSPLKTGFCLSFLIALAQKWVDPGFMAQSGWGLEMKQLNGGFSDFNAFGFFAGAMFLYQALKLIGSPATGAVALRSRRGQAADLVFLALALAAIFLSGSRTAFLFVLAPMLRLLFSRRVRGRTKAAAIVLLALALLVVGGTLGKRLWHSAVQFARVSSAADLLQAADQVSNGRLAMLRDSARMIARFPVSGVGAGDFLFYLKYLHFGEKPYMDLPLNQYLLFLSETGLAGGIAFLFFLAALFRRQVRSPARFVLAAMAVAILFNNFFWFPEALLLFWIFVASGDWIAAPAAKKANAWGAAVILLFVAMNIFDFKPLHPATWAREKATPYDYGFSYLEREKGREFRWSGEKAGIYIYLRAGGRSGEYMLTCGAPLAALKDRKQSVDVYWRGKLFQSVVFRENGRYSLQIEDHKNSEGFLEFRVRPAFNLKKMGLGAESRDLGVQVGGPDR